MTLLTLQAQIWKSVEYSPLQKLKGEWLPAPEKRAFTLIVHVREHLSICTQNNLHLIFKPQRPFHMLVLKSGMRYLLILKADPNTLLKKRFKILESEDSYVEVDALINKT